jgi:hypothetical protein
MKLHKTIVVPAGHNAEF